jgi:hypothetical protein
MNPTNEEKKIERKINFLGSLRRNVESSSEKNDSMLLMENVNVCGWTYTARRGVSETLRLLDTVTVVLVVLVVGGVVLGLGHFRF